jgi:ribosomal protein S18 acetylase RimI-like enzyme
VRDIRTLHHRDVVSTGAMLGRAFADNPAYAGILGFLAPEARAAAVTRVKTGFTRASVREGLAEGVFEDDRIVAASLVAGPGQYPPSVRAKLWQASGCITTGGRGLSNFLVVYAFIAKRHPVEPHFYLFVLGVEPSCQGRGFGKMLLAQLNARADAAHLPCWLETDRPTSVRLYESVGYEVQEEAVEPRLGGLRVWFMRRHARG